MVVDSKGRDLLDELQQIDSAIEKRRLEIALKVDVCFSWFDPLYVVRDVDKCDDVDRKLTEYRSNDVEVENVRLWSLL